jgi:hypothetical protein
MAVAALRERPPPNSKSSKALAKGIAGTNQSKPITLSPHLAELIDVQGIEVAINLNHKRKSHGHFSRSHGQNEQEHNLPVGLMPPRSGDYERQSCRVEHHLQRHQDKE